MVSDKLHVCTYFEIERIGKLYTVVYVNYWNKEFAIHKKIALDIFEKPHA